MRRVRWFAVGFTVIQFALFTPSPDAGPMPFSRVPWAAGLIVGLVAINLLSYWVRSRGDEVQRWVGYLEAVLDTLLVVIGLWLFGFDPDVRLWPLLTFPVLEGAMRAELPGALTIWALGTIAYGSEQLVHGAARGESLDVTIPGITFAAGILLFVAVGMGLLSRRLAEADRASADEKARLRRLAQASQHLAATTDTDSVIRRFVEASAELTGYEYASLLEHIGGDHWQRRAAVRTLVEAPDAEPRSVPLYTALAERLDGPDDVPVDSETGTYMRTYAPAARRLAAAPVAREGRLLGLLLLGTDRDAGPLDDVRRDLLSLLSANAAIAIENSRVAAAREETIADLEHLDEVKDDFLAILTHELRSPMTAMSGYAELLNDRWDDVTPQQRQEFLGTISRNTHRLAQLIQDVYDALRAERMELPVDLGRVDLLPVVVETASRYVDASPKHQLTLDADPQIAPVWADEGRATQILDNLLSNAVKYSPDGGRITVRLVEEGDAVVLEVTDEGLGIPERELERLFGKFARLHPSERIRGTGLGLYLTRQLVDAMGGTIDVRSTEGEGSTFTVTLPLARLHAVEGHADPVETV